MQHTSARASDPAVIVLAAGGSTRLGTPKQLIRYRRERLLLRAVRLARSSVSSNIVVVLGQDRLRLRLLLKRHAVSAGIVTNSAWRDGIATSIRCGLDAVPATAGAAMILLVDQVRIDAADLRRLAHAWRKRPAMPAAASYDGTPGVPAIFPRRWFRQLRSLDGDVGARQVLRRACDLSIVNMPSAAFDIDTPADVSRLIV